MRANGYGERSVNRWGPDSGFPLEYSLRRRNAVRRFAVRHVKRENRGIKENRKDQGEA